MFETGLVLQEPGDDNCGVRHMCNPRKFRSLTVKYVQYPAIGMPAGPNKYAAGRGILEAEGLVSPGPSDSCAYEYAQ